ncbi:uncharacterized protein [Narcine bancroftii]|uniref:uncharacterized protein isoform X2 n=1 Tax=Narcine bancroftii TaxID=1343680 RepID=UPI0038319FC3
MQPRNGPIELYILFILCIVLLISDVNAAGDIVTSKSTATVNTTATYLGHFGKEINQSETTFASASVQNTIGNSTTTTVSSGGTVAMPTTVLNSSQISVTPKGSVQTTTPSNVSSYSTPESPTTPTRATVSQVTTKVTSAPKPTQAESPVTSRESSSTDVTKPTTASLYTIITTTTSGLVSPLKKEEVILTICLSTILGVIILTVVMYNVNKCKRRRAQYSHHPLYSNSQEDPVSICKREEETHEQNLWAVRLETM